MRSTLLVFIALLGLAVVTRGQPEDDPAAWAARARREGAKTVVIEYEQVDVFTVGAKPGAAAPVEEKVAKSVNKLFLDEGKLRCEHAPPRLGGPREEVQEFRVVSVYDGLLAKELFPDLKQPDGGASGIIQKGINDLHVDRSSPLLTAFRGDDPALCAFSTDKLKPADGVTSIDGAECKEYRLVAGTPPITDTFWLDPARDYLPRRITTTQKGSVLSQIDITYRRDDTVRWVPASWVHERPSAGKNSVETTRVTVLDLRLNVPIAAEQFELQFPPGTEVADYHTGKPTQGKLYRVDPDGILREVPPAARNPATVGTKVFAFMDRYTPWIVTVGIVVVLGGIVLYVLHRTRAKPA
jgi:hypothetical protein